MRTGATIALNAKTSKDALLAPELNDVVRNLAAWSFARCAVDGAARLIPTNSLAMAGPREVIHLA
jgi:hypothetical protein